MRVSRETFFYCFAYLPPIVSRETFPAKADVSRETKHTNLKVETNLFYKNLL